MFSPPGGPPLVIVGALAGALLGGLLPRLTVRLAVPRGEPPRANCPHCGARYAGPASGWLRLGAPCTGCRTDGRGLPAVTLTALAWAGLSWCVGARADLPALLLVGLLGVLLGLVDLRAERLPNVLVGYGLLATLVLLAAAATVMDVWGAYGAGVEGAAAFFGANLLLHLLAPGAFGRGDVNLAALLGLCLGWFGGLAAVLLGFCAACLVFLVHALHHLLVRRGGLRAQLPYGPSLLAGALLAACWFAALR